MDIINGAVKGRTCLYTTLKGLTFYSPKVIPLGAVISLYKGIWVASYSWSKIEIFPVSPGEYGCCGGCV